MRLSVQITETRMAEGGTRRLEACHHVYSAASGEDTAGLARVEVA